MTEWLRADVVGNTIGVDRNAEVIRGYVMAQEGPFKTEGRGEFDHKSLRQIVRLAKAAPNGLKSRFAHPTLSDDGIGKFLGRSKNARLETAERNGKEIELVRGDLYISPTSHKSPMGDIGEYVLALAESDPDAFSSSLALKTTKEWRLDAKGRPKQDAEGKELPPLWRPQKLHASDVVDTGDAVDGFLEAHNLNFGELPDAIVRQGVQLLDEQFAGVDRATIEERCTAWLRRYLDGRFGAEAETATDRMIAAMQRGDWPSEGVDLGSIGEWLEALAKAKEDDPAADPDPRRPRVGEEIGVWLNRLAEAEADDYNPAADPELRRRQLKRKGLLS